MGAIRNDNNFKTRMPPLGHSCNKCKHKSGKLSSYQSKRFGKQIFCKFNETCKYNCVWRPILLSLEITAATIANTSGKLSLYQSKRFGKQIFQTNVHEFNEILFPGFYF